MRRRGFALNGQLLTELYQRRGWSQQDFADKSGLDVRTIAKVKRGGSCDASTLQRLAQTLGVEPNSLIEANPPAQATDASRESDDTTISDELKIVQVWKVIDLRQPQMLGEVPSGFVWERYRIVKRSAACPPIVLPYLTWGDQIACIQKPDETVWRRVPVEPGDIVHSDKQWELATQAPPGPAGTQFELGPLQLQFVNAFHGPQQQWWQIRIAHEIESLLLQILFADDLRCKSIVGTRALPGQRRFAPLPANDPHLLPDGTIASWHLSQPTIGSFHKLSWIW